MVDLHCHQILQVSQKMRCRCKKSRVRENDYFFLRFNFLIASRTFSALGLLALDTVGSDSCSCFLFLSTVGMVSAGTSGSIGAEVSSTMTPISAWTLSRTSSQVTSSSASSLSESSSAKRAAVVSWAPSETSNQDRKQCHQPWAAICSE
jgi:hypothetical protein